MPSKLLLPFRSWRAALVIISLGGTVAVCGLLAKEVHDADASLERASAQTLHNYATFAGKVLGIELLRRSNDFRGRLFGPVSGTMTGSGVSLAAFTAHSDSLYAADGFPPDSLRGYLRIDLKHRTWSGTRAMRDDLLARRVADNLLSRNAPALRMPMGLVIVTVEGKPMTVSFSTVDDTLAHNMFVYVVTQTRAVNFKHMFATTLASAPLLPSTFSGDQWNVDAPSGTTRQPNDSLIGVRVIGSDGTLLFASSHWFTGPYRGAYQFQTGPGGFTIQTVLRPGLERQLVPAAVRSAGKSLYIGLVLVGIFLLVISMVAFWGELTHRSAERALSMQRLTTGLRHELNNALASVMLESQLLAASPDATEDFKSAAMTISEQSERMRDVLRKLDNVEKLPVVDYFDGTSMVDLATAPVAPRPTRATA